ncbi:unnamed protein product [Notodromas monacha]|uniref:Peptidase metallopeptidase domain-containing protein n=1 Tax=Notodromas monacha TaxID=399045 RepID=A0A7R9BEP2_9CRUS|nr:unnamed protein product [Notodromas monacha]CAG0913421.1 unnamed protein product [Notodromas monacha]
MESRKRRRDSSRSHRGKVHKRPRTDVFLAAVNDVRKSGKPLDTDSIFDAILIRSFSLWQDKYQGMREELTALSKTAERLWESTAKFMDNFYWIQTAQQVGVFKEMSRVRQSEEELRSEPPKRLQCELLSALQTELEVRLESTDNPKKQQQHQAKHGGTSDHVYDDAKAAIKSFLVQSLTGAIQNVKNLSPAEGEWIRKQLLEHSAQTLLKPEAEEPSDQHDSEVVKMAAETPEKKTSESESKNTLSSPEGVEPLDTEEHGSPNLPSRNSKRSKTSIPEVDPKIKTDSTVSISSKTGHDSGSESESFQLTSIESPDSYDPQRRLIRPESTSSNRATKACSSCLSNPSPYNSIFSNKALSSAPSRTEKTKVNPTPAYGQSLREAMAACEPCKKFFADPEDTLNEANQEDFPQKKSSPKAFVLYELDPEWSPEERLKVIAALKEFDSETLLSFYPRKCQGVEPYLSIVKGELCSSMVGYKRTAAETGTPTVVMSPSCLKPDTATHELVHAVAFYHEEAANDPLKDIIHIGYPDKLCEQHE